MKRLLVTCAVCLTAALCVPRAGAQAKDPEDIFTKASKTKATYRAFIEAESPRGITINKGKTQVPAEDIDDVLFQVMPLEIRISAYRPATAAEKVALSATKEKDRAKALTEALAKYEEALPGIGAGQPFAKSHIAYKIAYLRYLRAQDTGKDEDRQAAAAKLKEFADKHPKAWQLARTLHVLAQLQLDLKQPAEAEKTYLTLAKADVAPEVKQDAEVQAVLVTMQAGKYAEAQAKLQGLVEKLPAGSVQKTRARLALAECLGLAEKLPEAKALVKQVLDETKDKRLRGLAHGTLGLCYWQNKQWQDARWEFLWVDTIYNQDKDEHAKALYYLADIFSRLGEGDRSSECRQQLLNGDNFRNSEYHRRALREEKTQ